MARGNQRDLARAKNLKKQQDQKKAKPEGKLLDRRERDADVMRQKQLAAEKKKQEQAAGAGASK